LVQGCLQTVNVESFTVRTVAFQCFGGELAEAVSAGEDLAVLLIEVQPDAVDVEALVGRPTPGWFRCR